VSSFDVAVALNLTDECSPRSSGIQVLPTIQPHVPKVTTFIREPTWVSPVQGLEQHVFTDQERLEFATKPGVLTDYRKNVERGLNGQFGIFLKDTNVNNETEKYMRQQMKDKLQNDFLEQKLIPDWRVGCRRLTPGVGYLEALGKDNVETVYGEITKITERGCVCDNGKEYPVDVLICATGFNTSFKPRFPLIGPDGTNLQDVWATEARSYFGLAAPNFPNYMIFLGPNCPIGNGPVLSAIGKSPFHPSALPLEDCQLTEENRMPGRLDDEDDRPLPDPQHQDVRAEAGGGG
jgi:cation diffusion facilitator CzcD-associated flavoprotein CzcO